MTKFNRYLRKTFEEDSDARRKMDALQSLLKGTAKKQANLETKRDGLFEKLLHRNMMTHLCSRPYHRKRYVRRVGD
jgi:hypothetical protein